MTTLQQLAVEAADLRPDGALIGVTYIAGRWEITVHVEAPEAFGHCDDMGEGFGVIHVTAPHLDQALTKAARRVKDAVADTPSPQIP